MWLYSKNWRPNLFLLYLIIFLFFTEGYNRIADITVSEKQSSIGSVCDIEGTIVLIVNNQVDVYILSLNLNKSIN